MSITGSSVIPARMRLYDQRNRRLYVNAEERERFVAATQSSSLETAALCLTLLYSGCRLSEGLSTTSSSIDAYSKFICFRTLKKRHIHEIREVPIPDTLTKLLAELIELRSEELTQKNNHSDFPLFQNSGRPVNRVTGYRWIKTVFDKAGIVGAQATPKGLRHGFGVHALRSGVPLNMLRKWMGHSSIETTAIYANAVGKEEIEIAERMWSLDIHQHCS
ncbi:site-specific integrase [uncultured Roseibium sp.]|uniref:tyrosine-type recombinase/integrase n=1 Tax=uncultured Roseibium sp. TaxID=1936171 RepID=UPI002606EEF4|nr:site-specific integrase [uncultured Roseibium sp.]